MPFKFLMARVAVVIVPRTLHKIRSRQEFAFIQYGGVGSLAHQNPPFELNSQDLKILQLA